MKNAFTIDLEDWFCAYNMTSVIPPSGWDQCELRVEANARRLLKLLETYGVHATFFVLGWIAEKVPALLMEIERQGHEIALHGYRHRLLTQMTPEEFTSDIERSILAVKASGVQQPLYGFRAPSFTVVRETTWALDILHDLGFKYDSSIFPTGMHPDYGIADVPLSPYAHANGLREFPMSVVDIAGRRVPFGGGGYFRLMPYSITSMLMNHLNAAGRPVAFYVHPWELDPGQPRMPLPRSKAFRHYYGLASTEKKLNRLLREFTFAPMKEILGI
jgi:polysaccharide deacetylase family protein (PEP-CTERM system associated)